jgi:hypothetical protein
MTAQCRESPRNQVVEHDAGGAWAAVGPAHEAGSRRRQAEEGRNAATPRARARPIGPARRCAEATGKGDPLARDLVDHDPGRIVVAGLSDPAIRSEIDQKASADRAPGEEERPKAQEFQDREG